MELAEEEDRAVLPAEVAALEYRIAIKKQLVLTEAILATFLAQ